MEIKKILDAIDLYNSLAENLIEKLISETKQPEIIKIKEGQYHEIQNASLLNGKEYLSENWSFSIHGEHCHFKNLITGQSVGISINDKESIKNVDPYFFYNFLATTEILKHITKDFVNPFMDMLNFFEELERQKLLFRINKVEFRKAVNISDNK